MSAAEIDALRQLAERRAQRLGQFRAALTKICDRTSERLRTKAELQDALDAIGALAASALAQDH